jgi:hypothetical protein
MAHEFKGEETSRREILRKGAFVAPVILTLAAVPSFAGAGSKEPKEPKEPKGK